ncbi:LacI family DNA-binding transcriptional regulator [Rhodovulum sp. FJ3]|uniref:LacI family DNA-binding transcriptional regulator n=1 Tax=Rhodovulum sp. FJ3 TaxID=3079053 RepID=UPI00293DF7B1|nr:LacI family DNA-binding transcriptional regulator [Rhodovulum sp. FJ3]MDV4166790.1 LacI family DNA-binding transcriptional regulator [Rhodovulum sp. FJ3]
MANRPTIKDVARAAGVSVTTVDRAINGRLTVREETLRKIAEAAHRVGYHGKGVLNHKLDASVPKRRLGLVLVKRRQEFYRNFAREIELAMAARRDFRGEVVIRFAASQSPDDFAHEIRTLGAEVDALACVAVNHRKVDEAVSELQDNGVPVFALLNDTAQGIRKTYLGLNNMKVGRSAAWFMTRISRTPGKLAVFVGGNRWHGHDLREVGFRSFIRAEAPAFTVLDTLVNLETRQVTYEATLDLLTRHSDLAGIYVAGGGMEGAIAALREARPPNKVTLIVNELTDESRAALADGYVQMVNSTPLPELCRDLVDTLAAALSEDGLSDAGQRFLDPKVYLPEML